jgi:hypothetical protein
MTCECSRWRRRFANVPDRSGAYARVDRLDSRSVLENGRAGKTAADTGSLRSSSDCTPPVVRRDPRHAPAPPGPRAIPPPPPPPAAASPQPPSPSNPTQIHQCQPHPSPLNQEISTSPLRTIISLFSSFRSRQCHSQHRLSPSPTCVSSSNNDFVEDTFTVKNSGNVQYAVKFKTSAPKERYIVKPSAAMLEGGEELEVIVRLVVAHAGDYASPGAEDKFIVQFVPAPDSDAPPKEFWATIDPKSPSINYERFRGHFKPRPKVRHAAAAPPSFSRSRISHSPPFLSSSHRVDAQGVQGCIGDVSDQRRRGTVQRSTSPPPETHRRSSTHTLYHPSLSLSLFLCSLLRRQRPRMQSKYREDASN